MAALVGANVCFDSDVSLPKLVLLNATVRQPRDRGSEDDSPECGGLKPPGRPMSGARGRQPGGTSIDPAPSYVVSSRPKRSQASWGRLIISTPSLRASI
jgi:hypothetical protein